MRERESERERERVDERESKTQLIVMINQTVPDFVQLGSFTYFSLAILLLNGDDASVDEECRGKEDEICK